MEDTISDNRKSFTENFLAVLRRDRVILGLALLSYVISSALAIRFGVDQQYNFKSYLRLFYTSGFPLLTLILAWYFIKLAIARNPSPIRAMLQKARELLTQYPHEILGVIILMLFMTLFMAAFTTVKMMIPLLNGYKYDELFRELDRIVHFGTDPWRITHAIFQHPLSTGVINLFYNLWFFVFWVTWIFFIIQVKSAGVRQQFLISVVLCWMLIGGLLAVAMSSAGPCYYQYIVDSADPFIPLMERLLEQDAWLEQQDIWIHVWAIDTQAMLWEKYITGEGGLGAGISAMPSMHVSIAVLLALGVMRLNRVVGYAFWVYAAIIQIGSVHLGWHYAIDGYFSIIVTLFIWKLVGAYCNSTIEVEKDRMKFSV